MEREAFSRASGSPERLALLVDVYALTAVALPIGSASSRFACGRGMTCTETSSPTRRASSGET